MLTGGGGADSFVFASGDDRITDFGGGDRILLDASELWSGALSARQVVARFGHLEAAGAVLDFGDHSLTLDGVTTLHGLAGDLILI